MIQEQGLDGSVKERPKRTSALREERLEKLMESCQEEVLRQIIGPFGLTPAIFKDVEGGVVTTEHNFEQGITANAADAERFDAYKSHQENSIERSAYDKDFPAKRKEMFQKSDPPIDAYTGNELPRDGRTHLDHVRSVKRIETDSRANLYMSESQRVAMANHPENLVPTERRINQSMQDRDKIEWATAERKNDPGKTNAESLGVDMERLQATVARSDAHIKGELRSAQIKKQGQELLTTGIEMAGRNALRRAFGEILHAFVSGSFVELKALIRERISEENLLDRLIASLKRVMQRVISKLKAALDALIEGGAQGFLSNFLTYLINCVVTTSAKVVTIIREGMKGLWQAIKLILNPPSHMSAMEVAREASKIIAGVVTMGLGMLLEESVKGFIGSIPLLLPLADVIAPAITAIITGITSALVVYGIDRLFDWLSSTGTELLLAQESSAEAQLEVVGKLQEWLKAQYRNSHLYECAVAEYRRVHEKYAIAAVYVETAAIQADESIRSMVAMNEIFDDQISRQKEILQSLLDSYPLRNQ